MAIVLNDNRYIKVNISECYIDLYGMHVDYVEYKSKTQRDLEKDLLDRYNKFCEDISSYKVKLYTEVLSELGEKVNEAKSKEELLKLLTDEQKAKIDLAESVEKDFRNIIESTTKTKDATIENKKIVADLGYSKDFTDLYRYSGVEKSITTSYKTSGNIGYSSIYNELKNAFKKEGYKDC